MKRPFDKNPDEPDLSIWADWLSEDISSQRIPETQTQRPHFPSSAPKPSKTSQSKPRSSQGPRPLVIDPYKFQEQRMQAFMNKQQAPQQQQQQQSSHANSHGKKIAVSFTMPTISFAQIKRWKLSHRYIKQSAIVAGLVVVVGLVALTPKILNSNDTLETNSSDGGAKSIPKSFAELSPEDTTNVTNERYDASRGFYVFNDKYKSGNITVTEQPLPDNVRNNPEKGKQLAQSVGATDEFETTHGMIYLTLSDTKTAQRAVLIHRQLLVFIQSTEPLDPTSWVDYVQTLQ